MSTIFNNTIKWFSRQLFIQKLNNPLGYVLMLSLAVVCAYVVGSLGLKLGALLLVGILVIPSVFYCIFNLYFGIMISLFTAFIIGLLAKYTDAPFGIALDALLFVMFYGLLIKQSRSRDLSFAKGGISVLILIWVFYNLLQVLNPSAESQIAWIFTVRSIAGLILSYFIACSALDSLSKIISMIKYILFLTFFSALYGLKQEFIGFSNQEMTWLYSDPERLQLILQWSRLRIMSLFSDPTNFGILMAYIGTFCFVLMTGPFKIWQRAMLAFMGLCMFAAMIYAGSRTPFVLVPFGLVIFTLLTLKKEVFIGIGIIMVLGAGVMMKSTSSAVLYRVQSAFSMSSDDTMDVRSNSRKFIQPMVYRHPFGFGSGSTGVWAARFTPDSFLAKFKHDSGFLRTAVELGWIGLIIQCIFLFTICKTSIYYYLRVKNPKIKIIYLGLTVVFFQLCLANYPQEATTILPTSIIFYIFLAITVRLKDFDIVQLYDGNQEAPDSNIVEIEDISENSTAAQSY